MENQNLSKKPLFNLNKVLQETGIKADTLRAWERRYQLPVPARTEGGHRLFSAYDIETIKWLLARQDEGLRISQAVDYWRELIAAGADPLEGQSQLSSLNPTFSNDDTVRQPLSTLTRLWIDNALSFNEVEADQILDTAFAQFPWELVCTNLILQGLSDIGKRWYRGEITVQQEHFAAELVVKKLGALTSAAPPVFHQQKVLLSCPPGEFHTIPLLMINTLLRYRGWEVTYLGANVPDDQLEDILEKIQPALVVMTATRLRTSAALLGTSQILQDRSIPLAFGGNAFTDIPGLAERISGAYLGPDLGQAISKIETLLSNPAVYTKKSPSANPHHDLMNEFRDKLPLLENQTFQAITADGYANFPHDTIREAISFLFQDILAALTLGDIQYLGPNIEWAGGLIDAQGHDLGDLKQYIQLSIKILRGGMSDGVQPLLDWLNECIESSDNKG